MKYVDVPLKKNEIVQIKKKYGTYVKVTTDIEKGNLVYGCILHADGEEILLKNKSRQDDIWDGGINMVDKIIDCTAVLNIRPKLENNSLEILNYDRRKKFIKIVKKIFKVLWQQTKEI